MTTDQNFAAVVDERNDNVAMNKQIRNEINVSNIIAIDYNEFKQLRNVNNLQSFVFQYDNIIVKITVMTIIFDEKDKKNKNFI